MSLYHPPRNNNPIPNQPFYSPEVPATFDRLFGSRVPNIQLEPNPSESGGNGWVRPADWLEMPSISSTEEKFAGLFAVCNTPENFIALYFEGDYVVDWGDNNIYYALSGTVAEHSYDWETIPGSTLTSEGYKQVMVTVTPYPGDHLRVMDLSVRHSSITGYCSQPFLDIEVSMPNADSGVSLSFGGGASGAYESFCGKVEHVHIVNAGGMTDFYDCFYNCPSLRSARISNSPNADNFGYLFESCSALTDVGLEDTTNVTDISHMFSGCRTLFSIPIFDTTNVTNMEGMFQACFALNTLPLLNTANVTNMSSMFQACFALNTLPLLNTANVTGMNSMFEYCHSLQTATMSGTVTDVSYQNCLLNRQSIIDIFTALGETEGATVNVQGNYGAADLTPEDIAIAVDKGWTVIS